jgi:hypothetical protein
MTAYGVLWTSNNSSPTLIRLGANVGMTAGAAFNSVQPWAACGRWNILDNGTPTAHCGGCGYDASGANGQTVGVLKSFYYYIDAGTTNKVAFWISNALGDVISNQDGTTTHTIVASDLHPAFISNGRRLPYVLVGAFEGYYNAATGKYESKVGVQPTTMTSGSQIMDTLRGYAAARGSGWGLIQIQALEAIRLMAVVECATWYVGGAVGTGINNLTYLWSAKSAQNTGHTASLNNASGNVVYSTLDNGATCSSGTTTNAVSYRGWENLWGNITEYLDGIFIDGSYTPWIADHGFVPCPSGSSMSSVSPPYTSTGVTLTATGGGNVSAINTTGAYAWAMFPMTITGAAYTTAWLCSVGVTRPSSNAYVISCYTSGYYMGGGMATQEYVTQNTAMGSGSNLGAAIGSRLQYIPQ